VHKTPQNDLKSLLPVTCPNRLFSLTFFTVATAEEIAQNNEHRLATYHNDYQAKQAFKEVSAALSAEELAEKLCKNAAR